MIFWLIVKYLYWFLKPLKRKCVCFFHEIFAINGTLPIKLLTAKLLTIYKQVVPVYKSEFG